MLVELRSDHLRGSASSVAFGGEHLHQLASAICQGFQFPGLRVCQGPWGRPHSLGEVGQDQGINGVGLGQFPHSLGKVSDLARVDDGYGQISQSQLSGQGQLQGAGSLQDYADWLESRQMPDQLGNTLAVVVEALGLGTW